MTATLVVPCRDEAGGVGHVIAAARAVGLRTLVVDNASTDATGTAARYAGADVVLEEPEPGKGAAIRAALLSGALDGSEFVVFADGDLAQYAGTSSRRLLDALEAADGLAFAKGFYDRTGRAGTALRPFLAALHPATAYATDPLCGEWAAPTSWLLHHAAYLPAGYGVDVAALLWAAHDGLALRETFAGRRDHDPRHDVRDTIAEVAHTALVLHAELGSLSWSGFAGSTPT